MPQYDLGAFPHMRCATRYASIRIPGECCLGRTHCFFSDVYIESIPSYNSGLIVAVTHRCEDITRSYARMILRVKSNNTPPVRKEEQERKP